MDHTVKRHHRTLRAGHEVHTSSHFFGGGVVHQAEISKCHYEFETFSKHMPSHPELTTRGHQIHKFVARENKEHDAWHSDEKEYKHYWQHIQLAFWIDGQ